MPSSRWVTIDKDTTVVEMSEKERNMEADEANWGDDGWRAVQVFFGKRSRMGRRPREINGRRRKMRTRRHEEKESTKFAKTANPNQLSNHSHQASLPPFSHSTTVCHFHLRRQLTFFASFYSSPESTVSVTSVRFGGFS